jgi:hypothetical protein
MAYSDVKGPERAEELIVARRRFCQVRWLADHDRGAERPHCAMTSSRWCHARPQVAKSHDIVRAVHLQPNRPRTYLPARPYTTPWRSCEGWCMSFVTSNDPSCNEGTPMPPLTRRSGLQRTICRVLHQVSHPHVLPVRS